MMYVQEGLLYSLHNTNTNGIVTQTRQDMGKVLLSEVQSLNKAEVTKLYGIEEEVTGQVFTPAISNIVDLMSLSHIQIDHVDYAISQVFNYRPSHAILLIKAVK